MPVVVKDNQSKIDIWDTGAAIEAVRLFIPKPEVVHFDLDEDDIENGWSQWDLAVKLNDTDFGRPNEKVSLKDFDKFALEPMN